MYRLGLLVIAVLLSAGSSRISLLAQVRNDDAPGVTSSTTVEKPQSTPEGAISTESEKEQSTQYDTALDGTGLIALDIREPSRLLLGATIGGGWDSNPYNNAGGTSAALYTLSPYVGMQLNGENARYLFQYQHTSTTFSSNYASQAMNVASMSALGSVGERWKWDLKAMGSYGQDAIRFLGSQQVVVGEVPGIGPNSSAYLANSATVTYVEGNAGVKYRKSARDTIELRATNAFSRYSGMPEENKIATVNFSYSRDLSPTLGWLAYVQNSSYYGSLHCDSYGGGLGLRWQAGERTSFSLSGGPQLNTSDCGSQQGFAYNVSFSTRLSLKSQIYVLSARQPTTSYLGPGLWQESVSGGYQRQILSQGTASFDVGYVASDTLVQVSSYHGTYFNVQYGYRLGHGLRTSYSFRTYTGDYGGSNFSRNAALFSLAWTPGVGHIFQ